MGDILGGVAFAPLLHNLTLTQGNTPVRMHKADKYGAQYVEAMLDLPVDSQREM